MQTENVMKFSLKPSNFSKSCYVDYDKRKSTFICMQNFFLRLTSKLELLQILLPLIVCWDVSYFSVYMYIIKSPQIYVHQIFIFHYLVDTAMSLGNGVYFDTSLIHCLHETELQTKGRQRAVYLCRVMTGSFTEGSPNLSVPPENKSSKSGHHRYDSVVDKMNAPQTFAVFQDSQAYPEYLIKFFIQWKLFIPVVPIYSMT